MDAQIFFPCGVCSFKSSVKKHLLKHLKECHTNSLGFHIKCLLCGRTFKVYSSFTSHVSRCYSGVSMDHAYSNNVRIQANEAALENVESGDSWDANDTYTPYTVKNLVGKAH